MNSITRLAVSAGGDRTPIKVAYVLKMFPRFSETFILNELLALEALGVEVIVFSMKVPDEELRQPDMDKLKARIFVLPRTSVWRIPLFCALHLAAFLRAPIRYCKTLAFVEGRQSRAAWRKFLHAPYIAARARREGVEHLHAHFASGPARQAKLVSMLTGIPFSFTAHAKDLYWEGHKHGSNNKLKKRVRLASFVVAISEYNERFIRGLNFNVPNKRVVTLYNGLNLRKWDFLRPRGVPINIDSPDPPLILAVGRIVPKKGFDVLVDACALLAAGNVSFTCVIAGDGEGRKELEERIAAKGLTSYVRVAGSIPQDRLLVDYYSRAALLAQPSVVSDDGDQDGIPTVILEALALGLPVISTPVSGIAEAVIDGRTGLMAAPGSAEELADGIRRLLIDGGLVARLAGEGRRLVETRFDIKRNSKILHHLMKSSARSQQRWSTDKIRGKLGLPPLGKRVADDGEQDVTLEA